MPKKKETIFLAKVQKDLRKLPSTKFTKIQQVGRTGDVDVIMCVNGHYVEMELKKSSKEWPEPLQMWNLHESNRCNGYGLIAFPANWDVVFDFLLYISGMDVPRAEIPRCLNLRPIKRGVKPSQMPLPE